MKHLQTINKKAIISNIFEGYGENFSTIDGCPVFEIYTIQG